MDLPDTRQLISFVALAETRSFTDAASKLHRTQSAISHSIKALETLLDEKLVERMGKAVVLTPSGKMYLEHARRALLELEQAAAKLTTLQSWGVSNIRVGAADTICQYVLPEALRGFRENSGNFDIKIETGDTPALLEILKAGEIDFVIGIDAGSHHNYRKVEIATDSLVIVVSPEHPWATLESLEKHHLESENFIIYGEESNTYQLVKKCFNQKGVKLRQPLALGNMEGIKEMARLGLGAGIVAPWIVRKELEKGVLIMKSMGECSLNRHWTVFSSRAKTFSLAEEDFIAICKDTLRMVVKGA